MFAGTGYAALQAMDSGPSAEALRAQRAAQNAALERKAGKAKRAARARRARKPNHAASPRRRWAVKADALCDRAYNDAWDLVDPLGPENRAEFFRLLEESLALGDQLVRDLERLGPAPNRRPSAQFMAGVKESQAAGRHMVRALRESLEPSVVEAELNANRRVNERVRRAAQQLGSAGCAQLFDPAQF